jgi:threonine dehydratase
VFPLQNYNKTGHLVTVDKGAGTIADGCNVKQPGGIHNEILAKYVD